MNLLPRLRPPVSSDADVLFPYVFQTSVVRNIQWDGPTDLDSFRTDWARKVQAARDGIGHFFVILSDFAEPAGACSVSVDSADQGEVGFWIGEPHQNAGLGTSALATLVSYSTHHLRLTKLIAEVFVGNDQSRRVLEKNGFSLVATHLAASTKLGRTMDDWRFERHETGSRPTRV